ncbi:MAG: hypothetical protein AAF922_04975 [Pseudomonadota bacterium]
MTDTLELLENQKQAMEADRTKLDADISDLDAAIKAIKSRRGGSTPKPKTAPKKAAPKKSVTSKKPASKTAAAKKPAPASIAKPAPASTAKKSAKKPAVKVTLDDAIVKAVGAGQSTPVMILDYVTGKMSVETTINSVRTRVSRLKREGKLLRGKQGWSLPSS